MCWFVAVAVPERHSDAIRAVFGRGNGVHAGATPAPPAGLVARIVSTGGCGCSLVSDSGLAPALTEGLGRLIERAGVVGVVRWWEERKRLRPAPVVPCAAAALVERAAGLGAGQWLVTSGGSEDTRPVLASVGGVVGERRGRLCSDPLRRGRAFAGRSNHGAVLERRVHLSAWGRRASSSLGAPRRGAMTRRAADRSGEPGDPR